MTKILSLVLALAMVLSMTALADGTVYYVQKFDYEDAKAMAADIGTSITGIINGISTTEKLLAAKTTDGKQMWSSSNSSGGFGSTKSEIWAAADGTRMLGLQRKAGDYGEVHYAFDNEWNMFENQDEIFVFSMDVLSEVDPTSAAVTNGYTYIQLYNRSEAAEDGTFTSGTYNIAGLYKSAPVAAVEDDPETDADETKEAVPAKAYYGFNSQLVHTTDVQKKQLVPNQVHRVAQALYCVADAESAEAAYPLRINTFDGAKVAGNTTNNKGAGKPIIAGVKIHSRSDLRFSYGNMRVYTIKNTEGAFNASTAKTTDVSTTNEKITVKFSQPVSPATFDKTAVTVTKNGAAMAAADFEVSDVREVIADGKIWSEADVAIDLDYASTYEIVIPETVKNEVNTTLAGYNTVTFTTEAAPSFNIAINAYEGLSAGTAITADAMAGKTVYFTANATNTTGRAVAGDLAIGIYDGEGNLVKYAAMKNAFEDAGSANFSAAFKMEAGYTAKAFVKGTASEIAFQ